MAGVLHDYVCMAHGEFESRDGRCPHGCGKAMVQIKYNKAPSYHNGRTSNIDKTIRALANDYKQTDLNNHNGTTSCAIQDNNFLKAQQQMERDILAGRTYSASMKPGENAIPQAIKDIGAMPDNSVEQVRHVLTKPKPLVHASYNPKILPKSE